MTPTLPNLATGALLVDEARPRIDRELGLDGKQAATHCLTHPQAVVAMNGGIWIIHQSTHHQHCQRLQVGACGLVSKCVRVWCDLAMSHRMRTWRQGFSPLGRSALPSIALENHTCITRHKYQLPRPVKWISSEELATAGVAGRSDSNCGEMSCVYVWVGVSELGAGTEHALCRRNAPARVCDTLPPTLHVMLSSACEC